MLLADQFDNFLLLGGLVGIFLVVITGAASMVLAFIVFRLVVKAGRKTTRLADGLERYLDQHTTPDSE
jgi:hypothetical protein